MGIGEEILSDMMAHEDATTYHLEMMLENKSWETKEGKVLDLCEMDRSHIENTINFIKRKEGRFFGYANAFISMFEEELKRRNNPKILLEGTVAIELNGNKHKVKVKDLLNLL